MKRRVVHFEIGCDDIDKAAGFYKSVFQWNSKKQGNSAYIDTEPEDAITGHLNQLGPDDPSNHVTIYIETASLDADLQAVKENGGKVMVQPVKLPDGRRFAWFKDVAGNILGLITPVN